MGLSSSSSAFLVGDMPVMQEYRAVVETSMLDATYNMRGEWFFKLGSVGPRPIVFFAWRRVVGGDGDDESDNHDAKSKIHAGMVFETTRDKLLPCIGQEAFVTTCVYVATWFPSSSALMPLSNQCALWTTEDVTPGTGIVGQFSLVIEVAIGLAQYFSSEVVVTSPDEIKWGPGLAPKANASMSHPLFRAEIAPVLPKLLVVT